MANLNIVNEKQKILFGEDSKVIEKYFSGIRCGRVLDVTDFGGDIIKAGHVIITDGKGNYKPMPVSGKAYSTLPESHSYVGVAYGTVPKSKPMVAIMTNGEVNEKLVPFEMTTIADAFKEACPNIVFVKDEDIDAV